MHVIGNARDGSFPAAAPIYRRRRQSGPYKFAGKAWVVARNASIATSCYRFPISRQRSLEWARHARIQTYRTVMKMVPGKHAPASRSRLPGTTYILFCCQAINLTAAVVSVTIAALVGAKMAPGSAWATIPYGVQFAAVAALTYPAAMFMRRYGRKNGFLLGAVLLMLAGGIGYDALDRSSFEELIVAHGFLGSYVAFANFYRFAAVDNLPTELRARGMSLVVAGGIVAAVAGPLASVSLQNIGGYAPYSLCYAFFIVLAAITMGFLCFWAPAAQVPREKQPVGRKASSFTAPVLIAIFASASAYLIMNLLMVQASLVMESMCVSFTASTFAIQGHVLAMFAPSFLTGTIISKIGHRNTLVGGFMMIATASILGILNFSFGATIAGLLFLGAGWNFSYVGGGALLAKNLTDDNRYRLQGINDLIIAICATLGAFAPAFLQFSIGWQNTNILCLFVCLFGCVVTCISLNSRKIAQIHE
jgi:MFS family permease